MSDFRWIYEALFTVIFDSFEVFQTVLKLILTVWAGSRRFTGGLEGKTALFPLRAALTQRAPPS